MSAAQPQVRTGSSLRQRLARYAASASGVAVGVGAGSAGAEPVAFDPAGGLPIDVPFVAGVEFPLDLDNDFAEDFRVRATTLYGGAFRIANSSPASRVVGDFISVPLAGTMNQDTYRIALRLEEGAVVDGTEIAVSDSDGGLVWVAGELPRPPYGPWNDARGYVGLWRSQDGSFSDYRYGFLDVELVSAGPALRIHGGALESLVGVPITVPEPDALAQLAVGAAAVTALRAARRRREATTAS